MRPRPILTPKIDSCKVELTSSRVVPAIFMLPKSSMAVDTKSADSLREPFVQSEHPFMSENGYRGHAELLESQTSRGEFEDLVIPCLDCSHTFIWTAGEQAFYRDKELQNPPKRCKDCKKAKNHRLEAIEIARVTGKRHRIEVAADCARCQKTTTVPFYPSQGRPVYCRACFLEADSSLSSAGPQIIH